MKIHMLDDEGSTISTIRSGHDGKRDHGVFVTGPNSKGNGLASDAVNACREVLKAKLGRTPSSKEIVAGLVSGDDGGDPKRFEAVEA